MHGKELDLYDNISDSMSILAPFALFAPICTYLHHRCKAKQSKAKQSDNLSEEYI